MSTAKSSGKQIIALLLALITLLSVIPIMPVSAETLSDGKAQTVTIKLNETHYILLAAQSFRDSRGHIQVIQVYKDLHTVSTGDLQRPLKQRR